MSGLCALLALTQAQSAELIYGFNNVTVGPDLKTVVEFDQDGLKRFRPKDGLTLRVLDNGETVREDPINYQNGQWQWRKAVTFSENLKFVIVKKGEPISIEYQADTKSALVFANNESIPFIGRGFTPLTTPKASSGTKTRLRIDLPKELNQCKGKALVVVFNKADNSLLWQHFGSLNPELTTDEIELSDTVQQAIVTDDNTCTNF